MQIIFWFIFRRGFPSLEKYPGYSFHRNGGEGFLQEGERENGRKARQGSRGHGFLRGALVLTAGMAVVKVLGALFKVPLTYVVGEYGIGMFNMAYHFYGPVFSLATAGFPIAVARLVSQESLGRWNDARQVKRVALPLFLAFGTGGAW